MRELIYYYYLRDLYQRDTSTSSKPTTDRAALADAWRQVGDTLATYI